LWDTGSRQSLLASVEMSEAPLALRFSDDGRWLACGSRRTVCVINTVTFARERELQMQTPTIAFAGKGETLITTPFGDKNPRLFNFRTGQDCGSAFGPSPFDWRQNPSLAALLFSQKTGDRITLLDAS